VLVCAPSNKAVTVALEQYLAAGSAASRKPPPLLVGVEDALQAACTGGGAAMEYFVYRRTGVLGDVMAAAAAHLRRVTSGSLAGTVLPSGETLTDDKIPGPGAGAGARGGGDGGGWCTAGDIGSVVRINHTESCAAAAATAAAAARALGRAAEDAIAELQASAPGFLSTRGTHSALCLVAKQSADLATFLDRPAYPCRLRQWLAKTETRGRLPGEDVNMEDEDGEENEDDEATADRQRRKDEVGSRVVSVCCQSTWQSALGAVEALRSGAGRGANAAQFASEAISRATLVFCTLASAGQAVMSAQPPPDALIVDEAAQALETELVVAFARRPRRCLLVGDPAQLPATMASEPARRAGHDRSLMQRLLDGHAGSGSGSGWFTLLDMQYRMHPDISSFPSARFYGGGLKDAPCVKIAALHMPMQVPTSVPISMPTSVPISMPISVPLSPRSTGTGMTAIVGRLDDKVRGLNPKP